MVGLCPSTPHRAPYSLLYSPLVLPSHLRLPVALTGLLSVSLSTVPSSRPRERDSQSMESRTRIAQAHRVLLQRFHSLFKTVERAVHPPPHLFYQERAAFSAEDTKNKAQLLPDLRPALPCQETIAAACIRLRRLQSPILGHSNQSMKTHERQTRLPFYRPRN